MIQPETNESFLPDFCRTPAVLSLLLISQIAALLLVLASSSHELIIGPRIIVVSLYLHWICLLSAAALCWLRTRLLQRSHTFVAGFAFAVLISITFLVSELAFQVGRFLQWEGFLGPQSHVLFVIRNSLICSILAAAVLRYFYVMHAWRRQVQASAEARFASLQARIRPHFFFNSLNSVAALIPTRPEEAERLIEDLSELFRAILKNRAPWSSLSEELEYGQTYLRIEQLRLGPRLRQHWDIEVDTQSVQLPLLCLQPLLENAVYHGIEQLPEGGDLRVRVARDKADLCIEVCNPLPAEELKSEGNHIALDNIRQRLRLLYDDRARLDTRLEQGEYRALLRVPI
ncbi:MAG: sensor histidine kinase [Oceanococcus sp.]